MSTQSWMASPSVSREVPNATCIVDYDGRSVVGSIILCISVILVAVNPLSSACRRIIASSLAR
jgi:hypothetical protein